MRLTDFFEADLWRIIDTLASKSSSASESPKNLFVWPTSFCGVMGQDPTTKFIVRKIQKRSKRLVKDSSKANLGIKVPKTVFSLVERIFDL